MTQWRLASGEAVHAPFKDALRLSCPVADLVRHEVEPVDGRRDSRHGAYSLASTIRPPLEI